MKIAYALKQTRGLLPLVALFLLTATALAQTGAPYDLTWSTVDGGGETFSTGGDYVLGGTIGQPDTEFMQGGDYTLAGGFWGGGAAVEHKLYLPLVLRGFS